MRSRAVLALGDMVAQMPTQAMISPKAGGPEAPTNITVTRTQKGMEFVFPAFSSAFYDPVVATQDSYDACQSCPTTSADDLLTDGSENENKAVDQVSSSSVPLAVASSLALVFMRTVV